MEPLEEQFAFSEMGKYKNRRGLGGKVRMRAEFGPSEHEELTALCRGILGRQLNGGLQSQGTDEQETRCWER